MATAVESALPSLVISPKPATPFPPDFYSTVFETRANEINKPMVEVLKKHGLATNAKSVISKEYSFPRLVTDLPQKTGRQFISFVDSWQEFFEEVFYRKETFSHLAIPKTSKEFNSLIVVPRDLRVEEIWERCTDLFARITVCHDGIVCRGTAWRYAKDFDSLVSDRDNDRDYAVRAHGFGKVKNAMMGLSAEDCVKSRFTPMSLPEYLLMVLKMIYEGGEYTDKETMTLCAGSRDFHKDNWVVPIAYWDPEEHSFNVDYVLPTAKRPILGPRLITI